MRIVSALALAGVGLGFLASGGSASPGALVRPPVLKIGGNPAVLARLDEHVLYVWATENDGRIHCTGECAVAWPPLIVDDEVVYKPRLRGIPGKFGVVGRPDGRTQLTYDGHALYAYRGDPPREARCDNVDGWFVVRLK